MEVESTSPGPAPVTSVVAGAVATVSYLPWVRALSRTFLEHHPDGRLVVLLTDRPPDGWRQPDDAFDVVLAGEVGIDERELAWRRTIYDNTELCCSLKPWILRYLLRDSEVALYLDSDICVYDSLGELAAFALESGVALTPHVLHPWVEDGHNPREHNYIRDGQFNAGCLAVGRSGLPFLDWWDGKLARHSRARAPDNPDHWFDQHWLDFAIGYFPIAICRDVGCNVAFWNLGSRRLQADGERVTVNGAPLRFMHFSGFNPANPREFTSLVDGNGRPEIYAPVAQRLAFDYAATLKACGWRPREASSTPAMSAAAVRGAIVHALIEAEALGVAQHIDPRDPAAVLDWLRAPYAGRISWFMWGFRASNPALQAMFPPLSATDSGFDDERFAAWISDQTQLLQSLPEGLGNLAVPLSTDALHGRRVVLVEGPELAEDPASCPDLGPNSRAGTT